MWIDVFQNDGDLHSILCTKVFNIPIEDVKKPSHFKPDISYRDIQKTVDFGLAYGMSEFKLADTIEVEVNIAKDIIDEFFRVVPDVKSFLDNVGKIGVMQGYIKTAPPYGRIRWFENYQSNDFKVKGLIERASKNHPIQGTNADIIKLCMVELYEYLVENNLWNPKEDIYKVKIIHNVHDEIISEVVEEFAEEYKSIKETIMVNAAQTIVKKVPMKVDLKITDNWSK